MENADKNRKQNWLHVLKELFSRNEDTSLRDNREIAISYFGRASDYLLMTAENIAVPNMGCTLEWLLEQLRRRGPRWSYELDRKFVVCTINGKSALGTDILVAGMRIAIFSRNDY